MSFAKDLDFGGRRALVTGAANGFGAAIAALLAEHGASLVLADREEDTLKDIAGRLNAKYACVRSGGHSLRKAPDREIAGLSTS